MHSDQIMIGDFEEGVGNLKSQTNLNYLASVFGVSNMKEDAKHYRKIRMFCICKMHDGMLETKKTRRPHVYGWEKRMNQRNDDLVTSHNLIIITRIYMYATSTKLSTKILLT